MLRFAPLGWLFVAGIVGIVLLEIRQFRTRLNHSFKLVEKSRPFSTSAANPPMSILVAGDSTAVGTGVNVPIQSIAGRLHTDFPEAAITNIGRNGLKTAQLLVELKKLSGQHFDIVLLQIGGNDILRFTHLQQLATSLARVLDQAHVLSETVIVMSCGNVGAAPLIPRLVQWLFTRRTLAVRDIFIRQTGLHNAQYIDLYAPQRNDPFALSPRTYYSIDGLHPSEEGYGLWYEKLQKVLLKLPKKKKPLARNVVTG